MACTAGLLDYFKGREDYVAAASDGSTFRPVQLQEPLSEKRLIGVHMSGRQCLGFYLMRPDSTVLASCCDIDNHDGENPDWREQVKEVSDILTEEFALPHAVEISSSGEGAHIWLFFEEPVPAFVPRRFWEVVADCAKVVLSEIYPRQDILSGKGLGNLVRYPYWNKSRFVDPRSAWQEIEWSGCGRVDGDELAILIKDHTGREPEPEPSPTSVQLSGTGELSDRVRRLLESPHSLLSKRWRGDRAGLHEASRSQSALAQSIVCELVRHYVPTGEIEAALRTWCMEREYAKGERPDWIARTISKAYDLVTSKKEAKAVSGSTIGDAMQLYLDSLQDPGTFIIPSGLAPLDYSIRGIRPGEMCIIAARPSQGKSAFSLQWVEHAASIGFPSLIISEEMGAIEYGRRALKRITDVPEDQWAGKDGALRAAAASRWEQNAPVYIAEFCNTIDRCEEVVGKYAEEHGVKLVCVDYIQLLSVKGKEGRYEIVTETSHRLRKLCGQYGVALIAVAQMNRSVETRENLRPKLSDLKESGGLEQDADIVLFCVWPSFFGTAGDKSAYEVHCAKRRGGGFREPVVKLVFDDERQTFSAPPVPVYQEFQQWGG